MTCGDDVVPYFPVTDVSDRGEGKSGEEDVCMGHGKKMIKKMKRKRER